MNRDLRCKRVVFGAPGSPEIPTHTPVWEGRGGNGSCEGLVSFTGDRNEGALVGHPSPCSHHPPWWLLQLVPKAG